MRILVATTNLGKIKEFQDIFPSKIEILSLKDLNIDIDVVEDGKTFRENALIKANLAMLETSSDRTLEANLAFQQDMVAKT